MFYLQLPVQIKWKVLLNVTGHIKQNIEFPSFDAALGAIYLRNIIDVIRIYAKDVSVGQLTFLRDKYLQELEKYNW